MEVDDRVQQREYLSRKRRHVLHRPVMGIEDGEQPMHPGRVDAGPSHEREVVDLRHINTQALAIRIYGGNIYVEVAMAEGVYTLRENTKWARHPEDCERLARKSNSQLITHQSQTTTGPNQHSQRKYNPTQPGRKHHLDRPIVLPRQDIQITRERDPRQQIREKHKHRGCKD